MDSAVESLPAEIAETIQAGHIRSHPDIRFDFAPSTAADKKLPVRVEELHGNDGDLVDGIDDEEDEDDIPYNVLRPASRTHNMPPLPDLRFEQSYLRSIANADTWWKIMLITARDQVSSVSGAFFFFFN